MKSMLWWVPRNSQLCEICGILYYVSLLHFWLKELQLNACYLILLLWKIRRVCQKMCSLIIHSIIPPYTICHVAFRNTNLYRSQKIFWTTIVVKDQKVQKYSNQVLSFALPKSLRRFRAVHSFLLKWEMEHLSLVSCYAIQQNGRVKCRVGLASEKIRIVHCWKYIFSLTYKDFQLASLDIQKSSWDFKFRVIKIIWLHSEFSN